MKDKHMIQTCLILIGIGLLVISACADQETAAPAAPTSQNTPFDQAKSSEKLLPATEGTKVVVENGKTYQITSTPFGEVKQQVQASGPADSEQKGKTDRNTVSSTPFETKKQQKN